MEFCYEALGADGRRQTARVDARDRGEALERLRAQGLLVMKIAEAAGNAGRKAVTRSVGGRGIRRRDIVIFNRQMKMLLDAGAAVVPALAAVEEQTGNPAMRTLIGRVRTRVEEGETLTRALEHEERYFDPVYRSMVGAGEATATLPQVFDRLSAMVQQQEAVRRQITGALAYPAVLIVLLIAVISVTLLFVVPRFHQLFASMRSNIPATTEFLFALSQGLRAYWPYLIGGVVTSVVTGVVLFRMESFRRVFDDWLLRLPVLGRLVRRLAFANVIRVWAAMLRSHIPLLEALQESQAATRNARIIGGLRAVEEAVSGGGHVGEALANSGLADPVIISAIRTGEENGRLVEAVDFVSSWMDDDNSVLVQTVAKLAEPTLLAVMGVVVSFVAASLFLPLFDLTMAA